MMARLGEIAWQDVAGSNDEGLVNLADAYNKEKGAVAYLFAEFDSLEQQDACSAWLHQRK